MEIGKYTIPNNTIDQAELLKNWLWLIGKDKKLFLILKSGDLLLSDSEGNIYLLNTGFGELDCIASSYTEFEKHVSTKDGFNEVFMTSLVDRLETEGKTLKENQVFSYLKLPLIGGNYDSENMFGLSVYEHFNLTGELNERLKNLP